MGGDLSYADLRGANLSGANLKWARLSGADLRGATLPNLDIPKIENINQAILDTLQSEGDLGLPECVLFLAGEAGARLEKELAVNAAASLVYAKASPHPVPDWDERKKALADMKRVLTSSPAY